MPRRIDIELTSALSDGSWTWRKAGALQPKGTVEASILPDGAKVGDELKVEAEQMLDGIEILSVVKGREKAARTDLLEFIPDDKPFEAVIETRAKRGRGDRDSDGKGRTGRKRRSDGASTRDRDSDKREPTERPKRQRSEAPPEVPQRPKPKRLRPGKARTQEVLAAVPEEQRPIAELALQGMSAVRNRVKEENIKLKADGKPEMPEAAITKMAEEMLPKLRVADWLDRAEAAQRQMQHLDLRDLRSVVAASDDPMVARDESTRAIADELKASLVTKQTEEMSHWLEDVDAALAVGRVIRALRLSSQPPKAGVMFPPQLAKRLGEAATASLLPEDSGDRWSAVLEAAAFSPVRALVTPTVPPTTITDDLKKTVLRLGPLLPQIASLVGVDVPKDAKRPKPLRPTGRKDQKKTRDDKRPSDKREGGDKRQSGARNDKGGSDSRNDRSSRPPKDRPKGMRDIATVMKAKEEAEQAAAAAAEETTAAKAQAEEETAVSAESGAADDSANDVEIPSADSTIADSSGASDAQITADATDPQAPNDADN